MNRAVSRALERVALTAACLTLAWGPLAQGSAYGWYFSGFNVLGSVTLLLTFVALAARGPQAPRLPLWVVGAAAFLCWVWWSAAHAPDRLQADRWAAVWTTVLGTAFSLAALARSHARQQAVLVTLLLTGGAAVVLALLQQRGVFVPGYTYLNGVPQQILTGPFFHPSHFSGYLITVAALCSTVLLNTRPGWHTLPILALAVGTQAMNLHTDGSSIPAVILAALVPFPIWIWLKRPWAGALVTAAAVGAAAWLVFTLASPQGQQTFERYRTHLGIDTQNLSGFIDVRREIHQFGVAMWRAHPDQGAGIGQWATEVQRYRPAPNTGVSAAYVNYAHSDYLMILAELGRIGAALLSLTILAALYRRGTGLLALSGAAILPVYLFTGWYDSHLTAIPGTMIGAYALILTRRLSPQDQADRPVGAPAHPPGPQVAAGDGDTGT